MGGAVKVDAYYSDGEKIKAMRDQCIEANARCVVVENDSNLVNQIGYRVIALLEDTYASGSPAPFEKAYVITFKDAATKTKWLTETGYDHGFVQLSTLPKQKYVTYFGPKAASTIVKNLKHMTREFVLDLNHKAQYRGSKNSDYFTPVDVDIEKDAGVYVMIDGFYCHDRHSGTFYGTSPLDVIRNLKAVEALGIKLPVVYALERKRAWTR